MGDKDKKGINKNIDDPETSWLWNFLLHSENIFTNRNNFFLVGQSMLMVSYATLTSATPPRLEPMAVIGILSIVFTAAWLYVNIRAIINMNELANQTERIIPKYKEIREKRPGVPANKILGILLPIVTLIVWITILIYHQ